MGQIKANQIEAYIKNPNPSHKVILIYGPDTGLVAERAEKIAKHYLADNSDPFAQVKLDSADIAADPLRLADEANTIPLFGGCRIISISVSGPKSIQPALEPVLNTPPNDAYIIVKAGDLKKSAPLRKAIEKADSAVALPCYVDAREALSLIIDEELHKANLTISKEAKLLLLDNLGADRLASRSEIQKLCLYAMQDGTITEQHIEDIVGDASSQQMDMVIDAVALGTTAELDRRWQQAMGSGQNASVIAGACLRHFQMLERIANMMDSGSPAQSAMAKAAPMIHFKRKPKVQTQLQIWPSKKAARACEILANAMLNSRKHYHLSETIVAEALLMIAATAQRSKR